MDSEIIYIPSSSNLEAWEQLIIKHPEVYPNSIYVKFIFEGVSSIKELIETTKLQLEELDKAQKMGWYLDQEVEGGYIWLRHPKLDKIWIPKEDD